MTRIALLWVVLLAWAPCVCMVAQSSMPDVASDVLLLSEGTGDLGGRWAFRQGDDPHWAAPTLNDEGWERLSASRGWGEQGHFAATGFAWYRRWIDVAAPPGDATDLELLLPSVADVCEVYWNGELVGRTGKMPSHASWPAYVTPHVFSLGRQRRGVLAIRVWKAPLVSFDDGLGGGLRATPVLGSPPIIQLLVLRSRYNLLRRFQFSIGLSLLYAVVTIVSFCIWLRQRDQYLLFWLGLFSLGSFLQASWFHILLGFSYGMEALSSCVHQPMLDVATWFLLIHLLGLRKNESMVRWVRYLAFAEVGLLAIDAMCILRWSEGWPQVVDLVVSELILIPELLPIVLVGFAISKRLTLTTWCVALFAVATDLFLEFGAFLTQGQRFTHWKLGDRILGPVFHVNGNSLTLQQIAATLLLLSLLIAVYQHAMREGERRAMTEREFRSAQELQRVLIPEQMPSILGYRVTSAYRPALEVGGDFFQLISQEDGSSLLIVGDVSGKGLAAAMTVSLIIGTIHTLAEGKPRPAEMLAGINRRLQGRVHGGFVTCVVLRLGVRGGITVACAGHPAPFLNGDEFDLPPALPLGLDPDVQYEEVECRLAVDDQLTLYSDGLLEARSGVGELYGFDRLQSLAATRPSASEAADVAIAFGQDDDITVVTVTRLGAGAVAETSLVAPALLVRT